jgi:hypothetical protein
MVIRDVSEKHKSYTVQISLSAVNPPSQMTSTSLQPRCVASSDQQFSKASRKFLKLSNCTDHQSSGDGRRSMLFP